MFAYVVCVLHSCCIMVRLVWVRFGFAYLVVGLVVRVCMCLGIVAYNGLECGVLQLLLLFGFPIW